MTPQNACILVADDVPENRDLLVRRLKRLGIGTIVEAENGVEALKAIGARSFDLVLLDIMMLEMDGYEVLQALSKQGVTNDLPVIVVSALSEIDAVVRGIELGAEDFIFKPFNPTLLRARVMASLEKKWLRDRTREELQRKRAELEEARTLQLALTPPAFHGRIGSVSLSVDVVLEPAKEVGGDLVDYFRIGSDLLVLILGDVSDKGAGAALMMARTHALVRGLAARPDGESLFRAPEMVAAFLNNSLADGNASCMFVTMLIATFDAARSELSFVRAGHVPPFLWRATGGMERLNDAGGMPLGLIEDAPYTSQTVRLDPGDRLLAVTDGFTEARDAADALFGDERIETFLASLAAGEPEPLQRLNAMIREFEAGQPASDDVAAILLTLSADDGQ